MKNILLLLFFFFIPFTALGITTPLDSTINKNTLIYLDGILIPYDTMFNKGVKKEIKFPFIEVESQRKSIAQFGEKSRVGFTACYTIKPKVIIKKDPTKFYVSGKVSPAYNGEYAMLFTFNPFDVNEITHIDSTMVIDGKFLFERYPDMTNVALISVGDYPKPTLSCEVVLEKGDITIQLDSAKVRGTSLNDKYQQYRDSLEFLSDEIMKKVRGATRKYNNLRLNFVKANIGNAVGKAALFQNCNFQDEDFYAIYALADDTLKLNPYLMQKKQQIKEIQEKEKERSILEGKEFFDAEMEDISGKSIKLSDYVGKSKVLLIDLWASWCGPCRADMPQLKSVYKDYKDKGFSILGISIDKSPDDWKKALNELDLPWQQTILPKDKQAEFRKNYIAVGVPYLILIGQDGKIIMVRPQLRDEKYMRAVLNTLLREH